MYISIRVNLGIISDYQFVNRFAFIPTGESKGLLSLATTDNESIDQDFVITATIVENPEYSIASPFYQEATVTILDNDEENLILSIVGGESIEEGKDAEFVILLPIKISD